MDILKIEHVGKNNHEDISECINVCYKIFHKHSSSVKSYICSMANWDLSLKAVLNDNIVGCYILQEDTITCTSNTGFDVTEYKNLKGLHGVGLAVLPEYQGLGIGKALRDYPSTMEKYDYIYGMHLESLKNLDHWKKLREVVYTSNSMHITIQDFRKLRLKELTTV